MKLFGFRINAREIKDVREIEKTLENIEEKKNKIIDLAGQLSTLTEIKFKYSADGSIEKKFEVDGFEMDKILGNMRIAQMQIVASYKSLEALGMIEITHQTWQCPVTQVLLALIKAVRKEMIEYERNTENLVNTTRILAERRKIRK